MATTKKLLQSLPRIGEMSADSLVAVSDEQLALMSTLKLGSVSAAKRRDLAPAVARSNVYRVADLREFCRKHTLETSCRLVRAAAAADPKGTVREIEAAALAAVSTHLEQIAQEIIRNTP